MRKGLSSRVEGSPAPGTFAGKVLLVEDDPVEAEMIGEMLSDLGYADIIRAATVLEALREVHLAEPDLVVLDASLRGVTAHEVAAQLKDRGIPFVVSTGYAFDTLPSAFQEGVPLKKPYSIHALGAALDAARAVGQQD